MGREVEYAEVDCDFVCATEKAVLVKVEKEEFWIPRSRVAGTLDGKDIDNLNRGASTTLLVAGWFAEKEGLA